MNIDLELVLVLGVFITGVIWLVDRFFLASRRGEQLVDKGLSSPRLEQKVPRDSRVPKEPWYVEYSKSFFPVLLVVLVLRSFVAEPFRIPSGSMMPTLLVGDFILVNKFAYGIRLPVLNTKIIDIAGPKRGDVAVFRFPRNPSDDYIKRIVGLPGDRIAYFNKALYVNGKKMNQQLMGRYAGVGSGSVMDKAQLREESLEQVNHQILVNENRMNIEFEYVVPQGHYFVLGDNRDNSNDSRYWGAVPEGHLVGKAFMIWLNWDIEGGVFDTSRIGERII
ncbi:MAG: signal peptidase I [Pseudomonadota bacterium]